MYDEGQLKIGDRVYRENFGKTKTDLKWLPGYRIVGFESSRTALIEHSETKVKARVNVRHLRWADPVSELISNSNIDVFPGESKLYFSADDLEDLNWEALDALPKLDEEAQDKADEIARNRASDLTVQEPPPKRARVNTDDSGTQGTQLPSIARPTRKRRRNPRFQDYICGYICFTALPCKSRTLVRTKPNIVL
jgi:hypothetical protein